MADTEKYYDFHCGNDPRLVKVAIKNESFHTLTIRSHIARAIDFSGGTALIETIRLSKCVKASRIIWPEHTGAIKRLFISNNDNIVKLDISTLTSLEELSILNCRSLEDIVGMPDTMKEINIHYAKIKELNLQRCGKLQKINIITNAAAFNLDLTDHKKVQMAMVTTSKSIYNEKKPSTINIQNAQCLHTVAIDTGDNTASLDITGCTHLKTLIVNAGEDSNISGLNDCKDLEFYHAADSIEIDEPSKATLLAIKERLNNTPDAKTPELKIASIKKISEEFQASTKNNRLNIHDRETNIQVNGSQSEVSKANAARISILSAPTDLNDLVEQKDLSKMLRNIVLDDASSSPSHLATLYFLPTLPFLINPIHTSSNIRLIDRKSPVKNILAWLNNNEGFTPNLLMINQNDLKSNVVKNLLNQLNIDNKELFFHKKRYPIRPFDKIVLTGDWYYIKNLLPAIAGAINVIPGQGLGARSGGINDFSADSLGNYQNMLESANNLLNQHIMRSNHTLNNRSQNLQRLRYAAEIKKLSHEFFHDLGSYLSSKYPQSSTAENPRRNKGALMNNDWTPQAGVRYDPYDGQDSIYANAGNNPHRFHDDGIKYIQSRKLMPNNQDLIDVDANHDTKPTDNKDSTDQALVNAQAEDPTQPTPRSSDESAILPHKSKRRANEPHDQDNIDAGASDDTNPADDKDFTNQALVNAHAEDPTQPTPRSSDEGVILPHKGKRQTDDFNDQDNIDADAVNDKSLNDNKDDTDQQIINGKAEEPPFNAELISPLLAKQQQLIEAAKKLATAVKVMTTNLEGIPEQVLIKTKASNDNHRNLAKTPPLSANEDQQRLVDVAKKLAEEAMALKNMPDQFQIDGDTRHTEDQENKLANTPNLTSDENVQQLLARSKVIAEAVNKIDGLPEQVLIEAEACSSTEVTPSTGNTKLMAAAEKLAKAVKKMTSDVEGLPDQVIIEAQAAQSSTPVAREDKLLDSAKALADAMKRMTDTACAIDTEKVSPSASAAAILLSTTSKDLKNDSSKDSLFEAATGLIFCIKLLATSCQQELPLIETVEPPKKESNLMRISLNKILTNAHKQYSKDHDLLNPGVQLFGRTPDLPQIRAEILSRFIGALEQSTTMSEEDLDNNFRELMKDKDLKYALGGIEVEFKECLRAPAKLAQKPTLKDE